MKQALLYTSLISLANLFQAWEEFKAGKRSKKDVQALEMHLEDNIFDLHKRLKNKTYKHNTYEDFYVNDPKRRHIHKSKAIDRVLHHLLYKYLYQIYDKTFIFDSYSCRRGKGTHKAVKRLKVYARTVSRNYSRECWALKLDIKKFFDSINHNILKDLLHKKVIDKNINELLAEVIDSFCSCHSGLTFRFSENKLSYPESKNMQILNQVQDDNKKVSQCKGIPLGNLTSQIFANIYLNELDQFVKRKLKIKYYLRYADDFVILDSDRKHLNFYLDSINGFVQNNLKLELHPKKIIITKLTWGIDFCGYVVLPHYILPRNKTKRRIFKKVLKSEINNQSFHSYLGYFSHAHAHEVVQNLKNYYLLNKPLDKAPHNGEKWL